jgi:glycosyltransferase involved in cell wall biosynthesis
MPKLFIITQHYPYHRGEEFMDKEVRELEKYFDVLIIPQAKDGELQKSRSQLSDKTDDELSPTIARQSNKVILTNLGISIRIYINELSRSGKAGFIIKKLKWFNATLKRALVMEERLERILKKRGYDQRKDFIYSVWMDDAALALSILKRRNKIRSFIFRLHGFDLFDERRRGNYMPFRNTIFDSVPKVFTLSQSGTDYLKMKFPNKEIITSYSGLYDRGTNPDKSSDTLTVVSCSTLKPLKRVGLIIDVLKNTSRHIHWVHFGGGGLEKEIKAQCTKLGPNVSADFKGFVENNEILEFYRNEHVDLFIHMSESEGLGMVMVEALSFGIPSIAVNVGGVSEVVVKGAGILLKEDFEVSIVGNYIENWEESCKDFAISRDKCKQHFQDRFDAEHNYKRFSDLLIGCG